MKGKLYLAVGSSVALVLAGGLVSGGVVHAASDSRVMAVGSTALQPLAAQAAEMFGEKHAGVNVVVQGGGSGAGLSQVGKGGVTIGNSDIFASQKDGVDAKKLKDHKVAVVGIAPVVNDDIKVKSLTMDQLRDIFSGKITNWKDVGGQDEKIVLINRAQGSGTRFTFEHEVMNGEDTKTAQEQDDNGAVQKIVSKTPGAISYLAFSYTSGPNAKGLRTLSIDKVSPTDKNVRSNKWQIWAYEHMYTVKKTDKNTKAYIKFVQSSAMKKTIKKLGYIPVSDMNVVKSADGDVKKSK
ncbi:MULTISPECIES: phosphate ABC transporter substrate-binding protein PstS family protein [Weissella]|jgi:phosphate binding protein|uniref:Phosphate-binding protein n=1 Tax=Weissella cibaria TaxID=137591 RepID=A0A1X4JI96_9LACO|nr:MULTISPECIES: phosphate ABC transporter substrate-binding protein PstS family protein [Weissella]APS28196.1 Phosphate-binding protein PstS 1 precursor [Weissella cibaria]APU63595.1 Phosphate-binding protein PstS 1 precursor [Weissella cibaria]APU65745.1 Phosphate-binding protein PstS 1 precursor [Weissella cibaria]ASS52979.1 Phosphate-binding protein PstS 1 [Weissella cibaria]AVO66493.1 phosphate ABC transporter substrate-binding protein [Weissella cibaria]